MFNFREELEKIRREKPTDGAQEAAEKILMGTLNQLRNLECEYFKSTKSLCFSKEEKRIIVKTGERGFVMFSQEYSADAINAVWDILNYIVGENYSWNGISYSINSFTVKF